MFVWLLSIFHTAIAECPINNAPIEPNRMDIEVGDLLPLIKQAEGCTVVIEIWASWCAPCVKLLEFTPFPLQRPCNLISQMQ